MASLHADRDLPGVSPGVGQQIECAPVASFVCASLRSSAQRDPIQQDQRRVRARRRTEQDHAQLAFSRQRTPANIAVGQSDRVVQADVVATAHMAMARQQNAQVLGGGITLRVSPESL